MMTLTAHTNSTRLSDLRAVVSRPAIGSLVETSADVRRAASRQLRCRDEDNRPFTDWELRSLWLGHQLWAALSDREAREKENDDDRQARDDRAEAGMLSWSFTDEDIAWMFWRHVDEDPRDRAQSWAPELWQSFAKGTQVWVGPTPFDTLVGTIGQSQELAGLDMAIARYGDLTLGELQDALFPKKAA